MGFSRFGLVMLLRIAALTATLGALAWLAANTAWYVTMALVLAAAAAQAGSMLYSVATTNREIARFLNAVAYDDLTQSFSDWGLGGSFRDLGAALDRVMERLRATRGEREEQAYFLRALVEHVPVALLSIGERDTVRLLNGAARRLFGMHRVENLRDLARYGEDFADGLADLAPGRAALVRMQRSGGAAHLKAGATQVIINGVPQRLISLLSIESELNATELAAWQALIRVLTHEMMNSLTPVSSLSLTALSLVADIVADLPEDHEARPKAVDARDALDAVARRSEGLLHFVQSYRRMTKTLVPRIDRVPVRRIFARLERLMGPDLADRGIALRMHIEPETLELSADTELVDQALINLLRNAMDVLKGRERASIALTARLDEEGRVAIAVADNGPGVPADIRDKIFVPFFTTKRQGTGVGLSLTRQIALVHNGTLDVGEAPGGGAAFTLRLP